MCLPLLCSLVPCLAHLHVAGRQLHREVHLHVVGEVVEHVKRLALQRRHARGVCEARRRVEVLPVVERGEVAGVEVEDWRQGVRHVALRLLAAAVHRDRLQESGVKGWRGKGLGIKGCERSIGTGCTTPPFTFMSSATRSGRRLRISLKIVDAETSREPLPSSSPSSYPCCSRSFSASLPTASCLLNH